MCKRHQSFLRVVVAIAVLVIMVPVLAQQPDAEKVPTVKNPLRFSAFAVRMQSGTAGILDIVIERWSTDAERQALVALVQTATDRSGGQNKLLKALQDIKPRIGFIRTPNSLGWDLKYAYESQLPNGQRQIVIATDKPVSILAAASSSRSLDYPFSLVEMQFPAGSNKGEGKLLAQTSVSTKDGKLQLELYGQEAVSLTSITEAKAKKK
jgi:hypothetical protein